MQQPTGEEQKARIRWLYNTTADHFDDPPLNFWNACGARSVDVAGVQVGQMVLDVCCGTGASAIPAAERVGQSGRVIGVDFSENLLELARAKARDRALENVEFVLDDMTSLALPDRSFDIVNCVFGIFFAPDMASALSGLWRKVRPGGKIALAVWGERVMEPGGTIFWEAVDAIRPELRPKVVPWERLTTPAGVAALFSDAGLPEPDVVAESLISPASPDDFWRMVLGTGLRGTVEQMEADEVASLRRTIFARLEAEQVREVVSDILYATAGKASDDRDRDEAG
jgi:ubiquinone/menaquinone biosynthesis C-methylase UbiE